MKPSALLPLALLLFPSATLATPPPELQDLLSAAAAATTAAPIPAGLQSRMVRRRASEKKLDDEAERMKDRLGNVVILPPGHFNHTVRFNGTLVNPATLTQHRRHRRNFWEKLEGHFGFGPSATSSAEASKGTGVVDKGKAQSDDGRHYWYVEDSDDQKHWREKDEEKKEKDDKNKDKRDVGDLFEDIANEVNAEGATSDLASATSSVASKIASAASVASSVASVTSSAAAASASAVAVGNSTATNADLEEGVWYDPTTWPDAVTAEYRDVKHKINELSVLSKVGLAVLVLLASVLLFALIYCACKLNARRRRRNAAERAQQNLAAVSGRGSSGRASTPASGRGARSFESGRDTAIPVMSYVGSSSASASTSSSSSPRDAKGKGKAVPSGTKEKKGKGWSLLSRD